MLHLIVVVIVYPPHRISSIMFHHHQHTILPPDLKAPYVFFHSIYNSFYIVSNSLTSSPLIPGGFYFDVYKCVFYDAAYFDELCVKV